MSPGPGVSLGVKFELGSLESIRRLTFSFFLAVGTGSFSWQVSELEWASNNLAGLLRKPLYC